MKLYFTEDGFNNIFSKQELHLPIRWNGQDFYQTVADLFDEYIMVP